MQGLIQLHLDPASIGMDVVRDIINLNESRYSILRNGARISPSEEHAFCECYAVTRNGRNIHCTCGEEGNVLEWVWDVDTKSNCTHLIHGGRDVKFHLHFSGGTAVIRGNNPITDNQHFWEIKMTSLVYGTDMMVGIGTKDADINKSTDKFCSVLGIDSETWGLSYTGLFHHNGISQEYASGFGQGSIIGVHLDMWNGTLSFYKNRQPLGIACSGLKGKTLYPMVSSTAARSSMRIISSVSFPTSLQFLCCVALRKAVSSDKSVLQSLVLPPGMQNFLANNLGWLLGENNFLSDKSSQKCPMLSQDAHTFSHCIKKNNLVMSEQESSQYRTCTDCSGPVFIVMNEPLEDIDAAYSDQSSSPPMPQVVVGRALLLENRNRFHRVERQERSEPRGCSSSETTDDAGNSSKKFKYSYDYAMGLVDSDSD